MRHGCETARNARRDDVRWSKAWEHGSDVVLTDKVSSMVADAYRGREEAGNNSSFSGGRWFVISKRAGILHQISHGEYSTV